MAYKIRYLPLAVQDLHDIAAYLTGFYPDTAGRVLREIETKIARLAQTPRMYEAYPSHPSYRRLPVSQYLVFYRINDPLQIVEVHRILRGSWNLPRFLE